MISLEFYQPQFSNIEKLLNWINEISNIHKLQQIQIGSYQCENELYYWWIKFVSKWYGENMLRAILTI